MVATDTPAPAPAPALAWNADALENPHAVADKAQRVQNMFSAIAASYDLNNHLHSLWLDHHWRRVAVRMAHVQPGDTVADIACGTGDLSAAFRRAGAAKVLGIDFCHPMLAVARGKPAAAGVLFSGGDARRLPLADASVQVLSIAFGIRNVSPWQPAMHEFARVLSPGGRLVILEFSLPRSALLRGLYNVYFRHVMPRTATWISGDKTGAYRYLPQSVNTFITRQEMVDAMRGAGFDSIVARPLSAGICVCYRGVRRGPAGS